MSMTVKIILIYMFYLLHFPAYKMHLEGKKVWFVLSGGLYGWVAKSSSPKNVLLENKPIQLLFEKTKR